MAREQEQFLDVVDRDTAERSWRGAVRADVLGSETVPLAGSLGRVLAVDVVSGVDVPAFDRSNVDGYAVRAGETFGASEEAACELRLNDEEVATGVVPRRVVGPGTATPIATGAVVPRGADAVVMVEHAVVHRDGRLRVQRPVTPGGNVTFAGTDVARGELVLRKGVRLTSRETGVLAAIGLGELKVVRRPRVAVISTGDEILAPGSPPRPASVYDANATLLADAVRELGGEPVLLGIVGDDEAALGDVLDRALGAADLVILSGGTSKGAGDLSYRVLARRSPGGIVHGV
ncbi:MAG: molybdopterin biosynthesis protein, partial [Planctomycetia bacterium]|nr:molybdopterin biosynthesis protein [Planctomycetia bacterium]